MLKLNDVYTMDVLEGLKQLPDKSAQIIIIDPPYNIGKNFGNNGDRRKIEDYLEWADKWISECTRIMKPNGTMFIYGFDEILAHLSVRITLHKRWLIWYYTNKNMPTVHFWQRSHEAILCCWGNDRVFNEDAIREPYTESFLKSSAGRVRPGTIGRLSKNGKKTVYEAHPGGALPRDVLPIPSLAGGSGIAERWFICKTCDKVCSPKETHEHKGHTIEKHPTQKPLMLCNKLIRSARQKEGFMLVPFVGSGSECVAAKQMGLEYIGFDLNPDYIRLAKARLKATKMQSVLV